MMLRIGCFASMLLGAVLLVFAALTPPHAWADIGKARFAGRSALGARPTCDSGSNGRIWIVTDCSSGECTTGSSTSFVCTTFCDGAAWQSGPCATTTTSSTSTSSSTTTTSTSSTTSTT